MLCLFTEVYEYIQYIKKLSKQTHAVIEVIRPLNWTKWTFFTRERERERERERDPVSKSFFISFLFIVQLGIFLEEQIAKVSKLVSGNRFIYMYIYHRVLVCFRCSAENMLFSIQRLSASQALRDFLWSGVNVSNVVNDKPSLVCWRKATFHKVLVKCSAVELSELIEFTLRACCVGFV